ncbi:hypothetical protein C8J56DRAFT_1038102 [Mycena floridula]|nr:hypothetical protein C8J56DRAFT_1038102 [Mycena floridula]
MSTTDSGGASSVPALLQVPALPQGPIHVTADRHVDPFSDDEVPELLAVLDL